MQSLSEHSVFADDFRVIRLIDQGGMGAVYEAEQLSTGTRRALKLMLPGLASTPKLVERFEQEAHVSGRIESDHVVQVVAAGVDPSGGTPWIAMELLRDGVLLRKYVRGRGSLSPEEAFLIFAQLGHGVAAAHAVGVVHRDLKPENIFVAEARRAGGGLHVKVLDFGIARLVDESKANATDAVGTPRWMTPEQTTRGAAITPATDVWAMGLIAFWMLTGKEYWLAIQEEECSAAVLLREVIHDPLVEASVRAEELGLPSGCLPPGFDGWFAQCVCRDHADRFASAREAVATAPDGWGVEADSFQRSAWHRAPADDAPGDLPYAPTERSSKSGFDLAELAEHGEDDPKLTRASEREPISARPRRRHWQVGAVALLLVGGVVAVAHDYGAFNDPPAPAADCLALSGVEPPAQLAACERACSAGEAEPCAQLGDLLVSQDGPRASDAYRRACDGGALRGCTALGMVRDLRPGAERDVAQVMSLYERGCDGGDPLGCVYSAGLHDAGRGVRRSADRAAKLYQQAAEGLRQRCEAGGLSECSAMAVLHQLGKGARQDLPRAASLFQRACEGGQATACNNLGAMHAAGDGVFRNAGRAEELFSRSCSMGEAAGCNNLGAVHAPTGFVLRLGVRAAWVGKLRCGEAILSGCVSAGPKAVDRDRSEPDVGVAVEMFRRACDAGWTDGCVNLGALVLHGRGVKPDAKRAVELFELACVAGDAAGCMELADAYTRDPDVTRDVPRGNKLYARACEWGSVDACITAAWLQSRGQGMPQDEVAAVAVFKRYCDEGYPYACKELARAKLTGRAGDPDPAGAERLLSRGCQLGNPAACMFLGVESLWRPHRELEPSKALTWLERACDQGLVESCTRVARYYARGRGVPQDLPRAKRGYEQGCAVSEPMACHELGLWYRADGPEQDLPRSFELFKRGCAMRNSPSCGSVGAMYSRGLGVDRDPERAEHYLGVACEANITQACEQLEQHRRQGR